ncbi:hypothetical protein Pta02_02380 [Planobispora takensis]|uniref:Uncharacterized protein n=1 Tax=Planobispora takensis TaxID=1367882 RepID=A0A8J3STR8_9ACTN|nr:hypothetical protein Pta02_02380 [Planobispora takensis]
MKTAPEGAYWHVRTLSTMTHPRRLGGGSNRYRVEERGISETWTSRDAESWYGHRELGVRPKSAADDARTMLHVGWTDAGPSVPALP